MRPDLAAFFEDIDIFRGKRRATGNASGIIVLLDKVGEMQCARQTGWSGADDQDIGLKLFALWSSRAKLTIIPSPLPFLHKW